LSLEFLVLSFNDIRFTLGTPYGARNTTDENHSTSVESSLQINLFLQNKANFKVRSRKTEDRIQKRRMFISIFQIKECVADFPEIPYENSLYFIND
jgi:hypothetical protein